MNSPASHDSQAAETTETAASEPAHSALSAAAATSPELPPQAPDRYQIGALLGRGGMADVYEAYDRQLLRPVALKFLRTDDPQTTARLLREARSQARIDHPNICKVYDVGTLGGRPFIAMQRVAGQSLRELADTLSLTQKVQIVQVCAQAMHAAHGLGVVHRDLKPSNILLMLEPDGTVRPTLVDFGLAEALDAMAPQRGPAAGTAAYMAPEQVRGDTAGDRKSDVYSLGATLYALLAGRPPFVAPTRQATWDRVLHEPPPSLAGRANVAASVPADLEAILRCCLQKNPEARYTSAHELAADLGRFLSGDPVHARGSRPIYRLRIRLRKQRGLWLMVAAGLLVVGGAAIWVQHGVSTRRDLARAAARFGEESRLAELRMRMARMLPAHDLRPDRASVRQRLRAMEQELPTLRGVPHALAGVALGRGYIALEEWDQAHTHLRMAWSEGQKDSQTAAALGYALAMLADRADREAARSTDPRERTAQRDVVDRTLRQPALDFLRKAGDGHAYPWLPSLMALLSGHIDEALRAAEVAVKNDPSLFEAHFFAAKAHLTRTLQHEKAGHLAQAEQSLQRAMEALDAVVAMARSDGSAHAERCGAWVLGLSLAFASAPEKAKPRYVRAKEVCEEATHVDPDNEVQQSSQALLHVRWAERLAEHGEDPNLDADRAIALADQTLGHARRPEYALSILGSAWGIKAREDSRQGRDPQHSIEQSIAALEKALTHRPNEMNLRSSLAQTWTELAQHQRAQRGDPRAALRAARSHLLLGLAQNSGAYSPYNELAMTYQVQAEYEQELGSDARSSTQQGIEHARKAVTAGPSDPYPRATLSDLLTLHAKALGPSARESQSALDEAERQATAVIEIDRSWYYGYLAQGRAWSLRAQWALAQHDAQGPRWRKRAVAALREARARNRQDPAVKDALLQLEGTAPRTCAAHLRCAETDRSTR